MTDALLTVPEVANHLKCSKATVWNMLREGRIRRIKLGTKSTRVRESDLMHFLEQSEDQQ